MYISSDTYTYISFHHTTLYSLRPWTRPAGELGLVRVRFEVCIILLELLLCELALLLLVWMIAVVERLVLLDVVLALRRALLRDSSINSCVRKWSITALRTSGSGISWSRNDRAFSSSSSSSSSNQLSIGIPLDGWSAYACGELSIITVYKDSIYICI